MKKGETFFTNAELDETLQAVFCREHWEPYLYLSAVSSAIDESGVAVENSLRRMETVVPCELVGKIIDVPDTFSTVIEDGLRYIKRLGQDRNRGLGRCEFNVIEKEDVK